MKLSMKRLMKPQEMVQVSEQESEETPRNGKKGSMKTQETVNETARNGP